MATATDAEILLYGEIGAEISDWQFVQDMKRLRHEPTVDLRINSGGGSVVSGLAIFDEIVRNKIRGQRVNTYCDGCAFSMAGVLFQAGSMRVMSDSGLLMLHQPFLSSGGGNAKYLRKQADALDVVEERLVGIVARRSDQTEEVVREWFTEESWFSADEAIDAGLADKKYSEASSHHAYAAAIVAKYHVPERYRIAIRAPIEKALEEVEFNARVARRARTVDSFESFQRHAIRAAAAVIKLPGHTGADARRAADILRGLAAIEHWERDLY